jgi:hypothetical protein
MALDALLGPLLEHAASAVMAMSIRPGTEAVPSQRR